MTRAGGDDVTIRVGSARGSREGFTATQRDLTQVGQEVGNLRRDFEQLGRMDAEPQVQLQGAQDAAGDLGRVDAALRGFNGEEATGRVTVDAGAARGDIQAAEGELHKIDGETATMHVEVDEDKASGGLSGLKDKMKGAATALGQGVGQFVGSAVTDAIGQAIEKGLENESSRATLSAKLAGDPESQKAAGEVAGRLYAQGYGESLDDVNTSVFAVITSSRQMRDASIEDIAQVTGAADTLSQVWGVDVTESMRAVGQMVKTGMVPDAMTGLALINRAFTELGPAADDTLDTVTEYSTQFRQLGIDGPTAMNMMSQALDAGARDTDTAADALKEFTLLAQSMPDATAEGYKKLGLSASKMQDDISAGGDRAAGALDKTLDRLRAIKDPTEQAAIATALFGTKAEDLQDALFAMDVTPTQSRFLGLGETFKEVSATMTNTTQNHIDQMSRGTAAVIGGLGDQTQATEGAVTLGVGLLGILDNAFGTTGDTAEAESGRAGAALSQNIGAGVDNASEHVRGFPAVVGSALGGIYGQGERAGRDLSNGFRGGILAQVEAIAAAARALAMRAVQSLRATLGAHSPATEGIDAGRDLGAGVVIGTDAMAGQVAASAANLGQVAARSLRGAGAGQLGGQAAAEGLAGGASSRGRGGAGAGAEVVFSGGLDSAFATAFMGLVRSGKIQIRATT